MTLSRRDFLRRTSLAIAGGLIVGDQALELFDRLSHRKVWALGGLRTEAMATNTVLYTASDPVMRTFRMAYVDDVFTANVYSAEARLADWLARIPTP